MYEAGKWKVYCMRCGFERMSDQVTKTWDNLIVCKTEIKQGCFETRHPQEFVRVKPDNQTVPFKGGPKDLDANGQPINDSSPTVIASSVGVQENTIPSGHFTTNNETL